jgi:hypothetical protein
MIDARELIKLRYYQKAAIRDIVMHQISEQLIKETISMLSRDRKMQKLL